MKTFQLFLLLAVSTVMNTTLTAQSARLQTVQANYARFGQGDIPGILATLAPDATWTHPGDPKIVPFAGTFNGREAVGSQFFAAVGSSVQITVFQPANFREEGNRVINDIHIEGKSLKTGKPYASDVEFTWTFNPDGSVASWVAKGDVSSLEMALSQ